MTNFTLGYIYEKFAAVLCDSRVSQEPAFEQYASCFCEEAQCLTTAYDFFTDAYQNFEYMVHYYGMYMSKKHEIDTLVVDLEEPEQME